MHGTSAVKKRLIERYHAQKNRGSEGFGYIAFTDNTIRQYKRYQNEKDTLAALKRTDDTHVLFHHRYPTSTENVAETAHPIKVSHSELEYDYYVTHNGVISNPDTLKAKHEKLGYKYSTALTIQYKTVDGTIYNAGTQFNDTEALAIELARNIELGTPIMACGSAAFIVLKVKKNSKKVVALIYGTNGGNPLTIDRSKGGLCIASEGGTVQVTPMVMYTYDMHSHVTSSTVLDMAAYVVKTQGIGYGYNYGYSYQRDITSEDFTADDDDTEWLEKESEATELRYMLEAIEEDIKIAKLLDEKEELEDLETEKAAILSSLYELTTYDF